MTTDTVGQYVFGGLDTTTYSVSATVPGQSCALYATTDVAVVGAMRVDLQLGPQADMYGYTCSTQQQAFVPADTTVLDMTSGSAQVTLPFPVNYYGRSETAMAVSNDGVVTFGAPLVYWWPANLPSLSLAGRYGGVIAPFWDSLVVDASASVRTATLGTAPNRRFVVEWRNVWISTSEAITPRITVEVIFSEQGDITFNYAGLDSTLKQGANASIGIQSPGGAYGIQYSFQQPSAANGVAVTFRYPAVPRAITNATISGRVTDDAGPVAGLTVDLEPMYRSTTTAADGSYSFTGLESAGYTVSTERQCLGASVPVQVTGDVSVDLPLSTRSDRFGYSCTEASTPFVPANTTVLPFCSSTYSVTVTLPFTFPYYGQSRDRVTISKSGTIQPRTPITAAASSGGMQPMCACFPEIGPYSEYLTLDGASSIRTATIGTAPNRQFVIEWRDVLLDESTTQRVTFEALLAENGDITFNYAGLDNATEAGAPSVRINGDWIDGEWAGWFSYLQEGFVLANDRAIVFHPPAS